MQILQFTPFVLVPCYLDFFIVKQQQQQQQQQQTKKPMINRLEDTQLVNIAFHGYKILSCTKTCGCCMDCFIIC